MNSANILVIDDESQIRKLLEITLEASGYKVSFAVNAKEGILAAANHPPDLIILDLGLPDDDGQGVGPDHVRRQSRLRASDAARDLHAPAARLPDRRGSANRGGRIRTGETSRPQTERSTRLSYAPGRLESNASHRGCDRSMPEASSYSFWPCS